MTELLPGTEPCERCGQPRHHTVGIVPCANCGHIRPNAKCHECGYHGRNGHKPTCRLRNLADH